MNTFIFKDNGNHYRVRKEESGCSVFTQNKYVEGNDMLFDILLEFNTNGIELGITKFMNTFPQNHQEIENDMLEICTNFENEGIFQNLIYEVRSFFENRELDK